MENMATYNKYWILAPIMILYVILIILTVLNYDELLTRHLHNRFTGIEHNETV